MDRIAWEMAHRGGRGFPGEGTVGHEGGLTEAAFLKDFAGAIPDAGAKVLRRSNWTPAACPWSPIPSGSPI